MLAYMASMVNALCNFIYVEKFSKGGGEMSMYLAGSVKNDRAITTLSFPIDCKYGLN